MNCFIVELHPMDLATLFGPRKICQNLRIPINKMGALLGFLGLLRPGFSMMDSNIWYGFWSHSVSAAKSDGPEIQVTVCHRIGIGIQVTVAQWHSD